MRPKLIAWLGIFVVGAAALVGWRAILASDPDQLAPPDPFPTLEPIDPPGVEVLAPGGADITPAPTSTRIAPPPPEADMMSAEKAREIGLRGAGPSVDLSSVEVRLGTAGDYDGGTGRFSEYQADYPLWKFTARGQFQPSFGPGGPKPTFSEIVLYIDPATGTIVGTHLGGTMTWDPTPVPAATPTSSVD